VFAWTDLLAPAAVLVLSALTGIGYAVWRARRAGRSADAVRQGRFVAIPVTVDAQGVVAERSNAPGGATFGALSRRAGTHGISRGHAIRDDEDIRVVTPRHHLLVDRQAFARSHARRQRVDDNLAEFAELTGLRADDGTTFYVGPPLEWRDGFKALLEAPGRSSSPGRRLWAAAPRRVLTLAGVALAAGVLFQAVWWSGHDVTARMVRALDSPDGAACAVEWRDSVRQYAEVDCYQPLPHLGAPVTVRALAFPFHGKAMDTEGSFGGITALTLGPAVLALAGSGAVAMRRVGRTAVRLTAKPGSASAHRDLAPDAAATMTLRQLASRLAEREGWAESAREAPPPPAAVLDLKLAVVPGWFVAAAVAAGAAWLAEGMPAVVRVAGSTAAAALLVVGLFRTLTAYLTIRSPYREPVTSEWDFLTVRTVEDEWCTMLMLGETPHWAVFLEGPTHLPVTGRCGVRGRLEEGFAIHLLVHGDYWMPITPVIRVDEDFVVDVRDDLTERLGAAEPDHADEHDNEHGDEHDDEHDHDHPASGSR
jgi:hypothetical protein